METDWAFRETKIVSSGSYVMIHITGFLSLYKKTVMSKKKVIIITAHNLKDCFTKFTTQNQEKNQSFLIKTILWYLRSAGNIQKIRWKRGVGGDVCRKRTIKCEESWRTHCVTVDPQGGWRLFYQVIINPMKHTHGWQETKGFLPQLDEFYFTTGEKENLEIFIND